MATTAEQKILKQLYYKDGNIVSRDALYSLCKANEHGITRDKVDEWLNNQKIHQLTKRIPIEKSFNGVISYNPFSFLECDLITIDKTSILTVIDIATRKAYAKSLSNKTASHVKDAFESIIKIMPTKPKTLLSDNGGEFKGEFDKFIKKQGMKHLYGIPGVPQGQAIIERFNGTLKHQIEKNLLSTGKTLDEKLLQFAIDAYNDRQHSATKLSPNEGTEKKNLKKLQENLKSTREANNFKVKDDIEVGETVRIALKKEDPFDKSLINWSHELYKVHKVIKPRKNPIEAIKYKLVGDDKEEIRGYFHRTSLQKIKKVEGEVVITYIPEKIVSKKVVRKKVFYEIKWKYYNHSENTLEPRDNLIEDVPEMVLSYEAEHPL